MSCQLFVAPVSVEVLDAALQVGVDGLICSLSQVPHDGSAGYGGIDYTLLNQMHGGRDDVIIERDHLKVLVASQSEFACDAMNHDRVNGFTNVMLHTYEAVTAATCRDEAASLGLTVQLGPGEDDAKPNDIGKMTNFNPCVGWISYPVGLKVRNLQNVGQFNYREPVKRSPDCPRFRAHNCDYLSYKQLAHVARHADGINLAPQLGTIQTMMYCDFANWHGRSYQQLLNACRDDDTNASRWLDVSYDNDHSRLLALGHYHYDQIPWRGEAYDTVVSRLKMYLRDLKVICGRGAHDTHFGEHSTYA